MKEFILDIADYLGITSTTVATILVTVTVFISGIIINNAILSYKEYIQRSLHRRLSKINYKQLLRKIYKQSEDYKKFQDQLNVEHSENFNFQYEDIPSINVLKEIGYQSLYKAYFTGFENLHFIYKNKKLKSFNDFWGVIEYVNNTHKESVTKAEKFIEELGKMNYLRNEALGKVQFNIEEFRVRFHRQLELQEPLGEFYGKREAIIAEFIAVENHTQPSNAQKYIDNLINLNRSNVDLCNRYERDIKSVQLNSDILSATLAYQNFNNMSSAARNTYKHLSTSYLSNYEKLKNGYYYLNFSYSKEMRMRFYKWRRKFRTHSLNKRKKTGSACTK